MKKIFTLFAAMLIAFTASAKVWNVPVNKTDALKDSVAAADPGDTLLLSTGKYLSPEQIQFGKSLTLMAKEGASPVIPIRWYCDITGENTKVKIIGVKFVGNDSIYTSKGNPVGASDHCIFPKDKLAGKELRLEGCEFVGFPSHVLYNDGNYTLDSLIVNNCYFHNNDNSGVIYFYKYSGDESYQSVNGVKVTNTTFANNGLKTAKYSPIYIFNKSQTAVSDVHIVVDHCTFYNNPTENTDHSAIRSYKSTNVAVSNCIFAHASAYDRRATCLYGGTISNCLTYNLTYDSEKNGHRTEGGKPTLSNNFTADPLFANAATGDLHLKNNWVKGEVSPAYGTGTNGGNIGDPRWYSNAILPDVNFSEPYAFAANKAQLAGNIAFKGLDTIYYYSDAKGTATWRFNATTACYVQVALNVTKSTNDHKLKVYLIDNATGNKIDSVSEKSQNATVADINLGEMVIPTTGDYSVQLSNMLSWSAVHLSGITLTKTAAARTLYLQPSSDWKSLDARFAICTRDDEKWYDMTDVNGDGAFYKVTIKASINTVDFCRMNPETTENNWDNKWTDSGNMNIDDPNDLCVITGWDGKAWARFANIADGYYIIGLSTWDPNKLTAGYLMTKNGEIEEYLLENVTLEVGDAFKAIKVDGKHLTNWYGAENDDNYDVTVWGAGEKTIYFRPTYHDAWKGHLYVPLNAPVATYHDFEINMESDIWSVGEGKVAVSKYLFIDGEEYKYYDDIQIEYNAYFAAQGFSSLHGYDQMIVTVPVVAGTYKVTLGKCSYAYNDSYITAYVKNEDGSETLTSCQQNTTTKDGVGCYHNDRATNIVEMQFTVDAEQNVKIHCAHYTPYIKMEKVENPTSVDNTVVGEKAVKRVVNGQLFIEKDGKIYNILGSRVK